MTEDQLIAAIGERLSGVTRDRLLVGIGDDAAVWQPSRNNRSVITTDALVEGVHFTRETMRAQDVGHRALAANLSDVAAMGARPVLATVALGFPHGTDPAWILACYDGMAALAQRTKCAIAGGDITASPVILLSITVVGEVRASNLKTRDGARPGDVLAVTGPLGASHAGLRVARDGGALTADPAAAGVLAAFRTPEPRLREGRWLGASRHVRALMDSSDGLSTDLGRLCVASGVGATIEAIPLDPGARRIAELAGDDPERYALDGGEDFELLVAIERRAFPHLATRYRTRFGRELLRIGVTSEGAGVRLANGEPIAPSGWDHVR
ncbi:MAG TPA: thiamine-phosphate kinase [Candidatus Limnocylindria bacterium]|jgi:thiamine-monophosphate kinase|nr:thiamine-phosphate kinase [Candidatus Limnocylindria bacterium]